MVSEAGTATVDFQLEQDEVKRTITGDEDELKLNLEPDIIEKEIIKEVMIDEPPIITSDQKIDLISGSKNYQFMRKITGLASTLSRVIINIRKYPFTED